LSAGLAAAIGGVARAARLAASMTQADVAERVGMAPEVYGRIERGVMLPSVPTLRKLCLVLRVSADTLLGLERGVPRLPQAAEPEVQYRESREVRLLLRRLRKLSTSEVRLLSRLAEALSR
jgi:transcriptional regulator with XRE-family HTH domain